MKPVGLTSIECGGQARQQAKGQRLNVGGRLVGQPAGAEQCIAETKPEAAEQGERRQPVKCPPDISDIFNGEPFDQRADGSPLDEARDERPAG
jgi:hypothetical protein